MRGRLYTDAQSNVVKRLLKGYRTHRVTSCPHPFCAHAHARRNECEEILRDACMQKLGRRSGEARLRICTRVGYSCTCSSARVLDRLQVYMRGCTSACEKCATACTHARLYVRVQESTCACMLAGTHARPHVCMQALHHCTHRRKLDLRRHAQSAQQL